MRAAPSGLRHPASASCLGRHSHLAGRCPNNSSLFPPLAAVVVVAAENLFFIRNSGISADFPELPFHGVLHAKRLPHSLCAAARGADQRGFAGVVVGV